MIRKAILIVFAFVPVYVFAQKTAYLNMDSVLLSLPGYGAKIAKLDSMQQQFSAEVEKGENEIQNSYRQLAATYAPKEGETATALKNRMSVADTLRFNLLEKEAAHLSEKRQTYNNLLQNQYAQDIQPLLTRVNNTIKSYARANGITAVYRSEQLKQALLYVAPELNITQAIIVQLGNNKNVQQTDMVAGIKKYRQKEISKK